MSTTVKTLEITGDNLSIENIRQVAQEKARVVLSKSAIDKINTSRNYIEKHMNDGKAIYGVNTGFGVFADKAISPSEIAELQINILRSHACGVGEPFTAEQTRAMMLLRANALARGHSGIRQSVVEKILEFLNQDIVPVVPQQGSVGASGDLAPLAHMALPLIGEGEVWFEGKVRSTHGALKFTGVKPVELQAKEGLSLINGCQVMTAVGALALARINNLLACADIAGSMTLEALRGSRSAFDPLIFATRPHPGEAKTARNLMKILGAKSPISDSHIDCDKVQDAYSLRCMPAVHGAVKDQVSRSLETILIESNSSTDNPLVFAEADKILSCGNFHGMPVAFALDFLSIAVSALGNISHSRTEKLTKPTISGLPMHLTPNGGLHSGMMMVQVAAASLVSENKYLCHPASADSISTNVDKEDHVSMGTIASRKMVKVVDNVSNVLAMEFLCAHQALHFLEPLQPVAGVLAVQNALKKDIPFTDKDRVFSHDIEKIRQMIETGVIRQAATSAIGELEL